MSDNYKPTVEVVRQYKYVSGSWIQEDGLWPDSAERALLSRGVPMVGDEVEADLGGKKITGVVEEHRLVLTVKWEDGWRRFISEPGKLRPATQNAEVEAVAKAVRDFFDSTEVPVSEIDRNIARAAIAALDRARGRDE